jgi:zinc protease
MQTNRRQKITKLVTVTVTLLLIPFLLFWLSSLPAAAQGAKHYTDLTLPPLPTITIPTYERVALKNGMVVYLMPDRELPLVSGTAMIRGGDRFEPMDKTGLGDVMATVMRSGGTKLTPGDRLNEILEQKAASIETGLGINAGSASFSALSEDLPQILTLFAEVLQQPAFPEDKLNLAKVQLQGNIARRNDDPGAIVGRELGKLIYGPTSPYARQVEYSTIDKITPENMQTFYRTWYRPENVILGIVGDFDAKILKTQIEKDFGGWRGNPVTRPVADVLPKVAQSKLGGTYLVQQDQLNQSYIRMGHLGGVANNPDYPALSVMNEVLSSFGGRLFNEIRSRQGLAYSVYASWSPQFDFPGTFVAGGETRSEATVGFVKSMKQEIERIRTQPITAEELQIAKESAANSFIFNFQDPAQTLSRLMRYEYFGYPADFIFKYQKAIENTSTKDVQRVAQQYLQSDKLVTVIVGNQNAIKPALSELGKIQPIDVTIPNPKT